MSLCNDPYAITTIDLDEYVGTSLYTINTNFKKLETEICRLDDVINNDLEPDYLTLNTGMCGISAIVPGFAKAWVSFNGAGVGTLTRFTSLRVSNVSGSGSGRYVITFSPQLTGTNYALIGTCQQDGSTYGWVESSAFTQASATINIRTTTGSTLTSRNISILVYDF